MEKFRIRIGKILTCKKGESLVESVVSILIFTLYMSAVTAMLATALRITAVSAVTAQALQETANNVIMGNAYAANPDTLTFTASSGAAFTVAVPVNITEGHLIAFEP
jgi:Tfp pilus assembly protein PilV